MLRMLSVVGLLCGLAGCDTVDTVLDYGEITLTGVEAGASASAARADELGRDGVADKARVAAEGAAQGRRGIDQARRAEAIAADRSAACRAATGERCTFLEVLLNDNQDK